MLRYITYNGNTSLIHTRQDIAILVKAYNLMVDEVNLLRKELQKLEEQVATMNRKEGNNYGR